MCVLLSFNFLHFWYLVVDGITEVYTIERITQKITKGAANTSPDDINGIVYAYLTKFNIDDHVDNILAMRW